MLPNGKKEILLIDDEVGFTRLLKMNLERSGAYDVTILNEPLSAIDVVLEKRPDLIILDMVMPGIDGGELSGKLRSIPELNDIPVIFLTALVGKNDDAKNSVSQHGDRTLIAKHQHEAETGRRIHIN